MNVFFRVFPSSSARRMSFPISSETGTPDGMQYNFSLSALFHGFANCDIASMIFFSFSFLFFIRDASRSRCYQILDILGHISCHTLPEFLQRVLSLKMSFETNAGMLHIFRTFQVVHLENNDRIIYESISFWLMYKYLRET